MQSFLTSEGYNCSFPRSIAGNSHVVPALAWSCVPDFWNYATPARTRCSHSIHENYQRHSAFRPVATLWSCKEFPMALDSTAARRYCQTGNLIASQVSVLCAYVNAIVCYTNIKFRAGNCSFQNIAESPRSRATLQSPEQRLREFASILSLSF